MAEVAYQQFFERGVESFKQKQYEQSLQLFSELINQHPQRFAPVLNRGTIYLQLSLLSQALADFNRSIELDPKDPSAYYNRAIVRLRQNRPFEALSDLYVTLSCLYLQKGQQTREIKYLTKSISLIENNVFAHLERGKLYKIQGNFLMAENDFSSAIELNPNYSEGYALRGSLYRELKKEVGAASDLKQVLALSVAKSRNEFRLDPQLKPMNDAILYQEILVKFKEIAEFRAGLSVSRGQVSSPSLSFQQPVQLPIQLNIGSKDSIEVIGSTTAKQEQNDKKDPADKVQSESEELLISDFPDKPQTGRSKNTPADDHSISKGEDSYTTELKIGKITTEIEKLREQLIQEGNTSGVFDSHLEDVNNLSGQLGKSSLQVSKEEKKVDVKDSVDSVINSQNIAKQEQHEAEEIGVGTEEGLTVETVNVQPTEVKVGSSSTTNTGEPLLAHTNSLNKHKTTLELEIVAATLSHDTELLGRMSPYCIITFGGQTKQTRVLEKGGKNPVWNDKLYFPLKHVEGDRVRLTVWDKETLKNDDMVGEGQFKPEETCTKCPIRYNGKAAGIIYIRVRLL